MVDDSDVSRALIVRVLERAGFATSSASDGATGVVEAMRSPPDVVVSDLEMTTLDGNQLARCLKSDAATRHVPVVILTSHDEARTRFWSLEHGADAYLVKGGDPTELVATVRRLAAGTAAAEAGPQRAGPDGPLEVLARIVRLLDANLQTSSLSGAVLEAAAGAENLEGAIRSALEALSRVVDCHALGIALAGPSGATLYLSTPVALERRSRTRLERAFAAAVPSSPSRRLEVVDLAPAAAGPLAVDPGLLVTLPLPTRSAPGVLGGLPRRGDDWIRDAAPLVAAVLRPLALALDNAVLTDRLRDLSVHDGLTGLLNHRAVYERLGEELARSARYGGDLSVVLVDLDRFKRVNDRHGHVVGDAVLRRVSAALRSDLRSCDTLGRLGGEEFLAMLPSTGLDGAVEVASRMRSLVHDTSTPVPRGRPVRVTASFGVASLSELTSPARSEELVALADRRLYASKQSGRDRVTSTGP